MSVLPQPGGPYRSMPRTWLMPSCRMMCDGQMRDAKARRKISLNSESNPPMPSFSKSKSERKMLDAPPAPPATRDPASCRAVQPWALEKVTDVGPRSSPILGLPLTSPPPSRSSWPTDDTVSSSLPPSKSMARTRPTSNTCPSKFSSTSCARRSVSISRGGARLPPWAALLRLAKVSTDSSSVTRAKLGGGAKGRTSTLALRLYCP
mmetsp:Transcript_3600/g.10247  ORF Transcript_3600/g.10247 Transcript_3600/m.10247 type:complete len:206 (-) Transcript_3600:523-1140(-)